MRFLKEKFPGSLPLVCIAMAELESRFIGRTLCLPDGIGALFAIELFRRLDKEKPLRIQRLYIGFFGGPNGTASRIFEIEIALRG